MKLDFFRNHKVIFGIILMAIGIGALVYILQLWPAVVNRPEDFSTLHRQGDLRNNVYVEAHIDFVYEEYFPKKTDYRESENKHYYIVQIEDAVCSLTTKDKDLVLSLNTVKAQTDLYFENLNSTVVTFDPPEGVTVRGTMKGLSGQKGREYSIEKHKVPSLTDRKVHVYSLDLDHTFRQGQAVTDVLCGLAFLIWGAVSTILGARQFFENQQAKTDVRVLEFGKNVGEHAILNSQYGDAWKNHIADGNAPDEISDNEDEKREDRPGYFGWRDDYDDYDDYDYDDDDYDDNDYDDDDEGGSL